MLFCFIIQNLRYLNKKQNLDYEKTDFFVSHQLFAICPK